MKRWGVIIAVALTLLLRNAREVKAQVIVPSVVSDPVICPDGCTANVVIAIDEVGFGVVYTVTGTDTPIAVPGGYSLATLQAFSQAQPAPSTGSLLVGGGVTPVTTGTLGTRYADGRYAGFYKAPNGQYFPITVTDKNAGRKAKYHPSDTYNCPSDQEPYFGTDAETWTDCCRGGGCPAGNRVKITGRCNAHKGVEGGTVYDTLVTITKTCTPKCQDAGTIFVGKYKWVCNKDGDNCRNVLGCVCKIISACHSE